MSQMTGSSLACLKMAKVHLSISGLSNSSRYGTGYNVFRFIIGTFFMGFRLRACYRILSRTVPMLDASSKLPDGLLAGNTFQMGHFDECLAVKYTVDDNRNLRGQYCLAHVEYSPRNLTIETVPHHSLSDLFNISAWHYIKSFSFDRTKIRRDEIYWSVCVPSSCSPADVQEALSDLLVERAGELGIDVSVTIGKNMCQVDTNGYDFSWIGVGQILVGLPVLAFVALVMLSTFLQAIGKVERNHKSGVGKFLNCFSGQNNFNSLRRVDKSRDIMIIHTFRFFSMIVILLGHRFISDGPAPVYNADYNEKVVTDYRFIYFLVAPILVVDTFFLLSGFLTGTQIFNDFDSGSFKLLSFYIHRYIRLTPVYMLVVAFFALFLLHLGSGPLWLARVTIEQDRCADNWWTNMFYINNYVHPTRLCMFQSWHLTCDFHFLLAAPALVYILWKCPKFGLAVISVLVAICAGLLFGITFVNELDPSLLSYKSVVADLCADPTFILTYIPTHTRYMPYLFGILGAYAYYKRKSYGVIPPRFIYLGAVIVGVLLNMPIFSAILFYSEGVEYDVWRASLFAALHRIPWSLGLVVMIVMTATKNAYFFQKMLEWRALAPLSRLTYCVFLIHTSVQLYSAATLRRPQYMTNFNFFKTLMGDILATYLIAFLVHIFFEAPILRLDRAYLSTGNQSNHQTGRANGQIVLLSNAYQRPLGVLPKGRRPWQRTLVSKFPRKQSVGEVNRAYTADAPVTFSNAETQFSITGGVHKKYRDRCDHYAKRTTTSAAPSRLES